MKIDAARQTVDRLIYDQLRNCTDLLWTGISESKRPDPNCPWCDDVTGKLVPYPAEADRIVVEWCSKSNFLFTGGLVIRFIDGGQLCICISHVDFAPGQKPVPSGPIRYVVNRGTYAGHTFTCVPSAGAPLCLSS